MLFSQEPGDWDLAAFEASTVNIPFGMDTVQGRARGTRAVLALRPPRPECGPDQVRPWNLPSGVERLGFAFCVGQRSGHLELCVLVSVHDAAGSEGLASPANRPSQQASSGGSACAHCARLLLYPVLGTRPLSVSSSEDHVWVGQLFNSH